jgi:hypothetical protein
MLSSAYLRAGAWRSLRTLWRDWAAAEALGRCGAAPDAVALLVGRTLWRRGLDAVAVLTLLAVAAAG